MNKKLIFLLVLLMGGFCLKIAFGAMGDQFTMGWDYTRDLDTWRVTANGDLIPGTESVVDIGSSTQEVAEGHFDTIYLGGTSKSSWGSVVSPMTDYSGYVAPTDAGSNLKLHDDGDLTLGGAVATDVQITWDGNNNDFHIGLDDSTDDLIIGYDATIATDARITIMNDADNTIVTIGDNTAYDNYLLFDGADQNWYFGLDDSIDHFVMGGGSSLNASSHCVGMATGPSAKVMLWHGLDGYGVVDIDYGSSDITDHEFTTDGGRFAIDGVQATFDVATNLDSISSPADDTIRVQSEDSDSTFEIWGTDTMDAILALTSDRSDDSGDDWHIKNDDADSNNLIFIGDSTGSDVTYLTLGNTGLLTTVNDIYVVNSDTTLSSVTDVMRIQHDTSSGTAADNGYSTSATGETGMGVGILWYLEDSGGTTEEMGSIDLVCTDVTDASEDASWVFSNITNGTVKETLRIDAEGGSVSCDVLQFTSNSEETDASLNIMVLRRNIMDGNGATNIGAGISIEIDDAGGIEEQASIDFNLTDGTAAGEDCDIIFSQNVAGTITERVLFDADNDLGAIVVKGATPAITIGDGGAEDTLLLFDGHSGGADWIMGIHDNTDDFRICEGSNSSSSDVLKVAKGTHLITIPQAGLLVSGITPTVTIGDGGTEDSLLVFDGAAVDYTLGTHDNTDEFTLANGTLSGSVLATMDSSGNLSVAGDVTLLGGEIIADSAIAVTTDNNQGYKYKYYPFSYLGPGTLGVGEGISPFNQTGIDIGSADTGEVEGLVKMSDIDDYIRFRIQLPDTFVDGGNIGDLDLALDVSPVSGMEHIAPSLNVIFYERANTTAILHATMEVSNSVARKFVTMTTLGGGFGDDADIDPDDVLTITLSPVGATSDFEIYGARLKYRTGFDNTVAPGDE